MSVKSMRMCLPVLLKEYHCLQCGDSCRGWNIEVFPRKFGQILQLLSSLPPNARPPGDVFEVLKENGRIKEAHLKMRAGQCVFLEEDRKCYLHKRFGPTAKPAICQSYPFYGISTPRVTLIGASMACQAIVRLLARESAWQICRVPAGLVPALTLKASYDHAFVLHLHAKARLTWPAFYYLHNFLMQSERGRLEHSMQLLWQAFSPVEGLVNLSRCKELLAQRTYKMVPLEGLVHIQTIRRILQTYSQVYPYGHGATCIERLITPISNILEKEQQLCEWYQKQFSRHYQQFSAANPLIENYLRVMLFAWEYFFSKGFLPALTLSALILGLVRFLGLAGLNDSTCPTNLNQVILLVDRYFLHTDKFWQEFTIPHLVPLEVTGLRHGYVP